MWFLTAHALYIGTDAMSVTICCTDTMLTFFQRFEAHFHRQIAIRPCSLCLRAPEWLKMGNTLPGRQDCY